jgi:glycosyltransferase involved in cell wall biosynthesis
MSVRATRVYRVGPVLTRRVTGGAIGASGNTGMKPMVILIPSYNNRHWYEQNLASVCAQQYDNFRAIYVDDGSSDQTGPLVDQFLADQAVGHRIQLIRNPVRMGALENLYRHIHTCADQEIVMLLDGDDWLAHPRVLQTLNAVYADPHCWMTYGQYTSWPSPAPGYSRPIPAQVTETNTFRAYDWCASHLRSFYAWLFKRINREDLISPWGTFYPMAWDQALMLPMLEMAGPRAKFIPEVLYTYNTANPLNDAKVNRPLQRQCETAIRQQKPYARLESDPLHMPPSSHQN